MTSPDAPDETKDVIVHYMKTVDARSGKSYERWVVYLGDEQQGEADNLEAALNHARQLAAVRNLRAWLLDQGGYPLKPIMLGGQT
jgi:hypothetical protein